MDKYSPLPAKVRIGTLPFIFQLEILSSIKAICFLECRFIENLLSICFDERCLVVIVSSIKAFCFVECLSLALIGDWSSFI